MDKTYVTKECQCYSEQCTEGVYAEKGHNLSARVLRLFGVDRSFKEPLSSMQRINHTWAALGHSATILEAKHAMLEAERKKAEALQASQRYQLI